MFLLQLLNIQVCAAAIIGAGVFSVVYSQLVGFGRQHFCHFFSTHPICDICDKYQVWPHLGPQKGPFWLKIPLLETLKVIGGPDLVPTAPGAKEEREDGGGHKWGGCEGGDEPDKIGEGSARTRAGRDGTWCPKNEVFSNFMCSLLEQLRPAYHRLWAEN